MIGYHDLLIFKDTGQGSRSQGDKSTFSNFSVNHHPIFHYFNGLQCLTRRISDINFGCVNVHVGQRSRSHGGNLGESVGLHFLSCFQRISVKLGLYIGSTLSIYSMNFQLCSSNIKDTLNKTENASNVRICNLNDIV